MWSNPQRLSQSMQILHLPEFVVQSSEVPDVLARHRGPQVRCQNRTLVQAARRVAAWEPYVYTAVIVLGCGRAGQVRQHT